MFLFGGFSRAWAAGYNFINGKRSVILALEDLVYSSVVKSMEVGGRQWLKSGYRFTTYPVLQISKLLC